ncbi:MAG: hypothetical protein M3203_03280 [Actinomycetota bacterium]|nr:hypothetical protein [Actinomycetota bacterium]
MDGGVPAVNSRRMSRSRAGDRRMNGAAPALWALAVMSLVATGLGAAGAGMATDDEPNHEVWVIDQSDTRADGGGTLYVYPGDQLAGRDAGAATPEVIDLGGAARTLCLDATHSAPRRPHMLAFDSRHTRAVVSFVTTGHVLFLDAATRAPVGCIDVGVQAHAAQPTPDDRSVIVANQNGKLLQRITTDYATNTFVLDSAATLDLAHCVTPSGALCEEPTLRRDNAPICPIIDASGRFAFVTLRGGGMFVVETSSTPMRIVAEYDRSVVHPNGCGGVESSGKMYVNSGGGTPINPSESDLYAFPINGFSSAPNAPNTPAPHIVFSHDDREPADSHGVVLTKGGRYVWAADRAANIMVVVDTTTDAVVNEIQLAGAVSPDPTPDLLALSPAGNRVYAALRGPVPLTGNAPNNNAKGSTPGVGVLRVQAGGAAGELQGVARITHVVGGVEAADPHGIGVRRR